MDDNRLIDMETRFAYQEKLIADLNDVVTQQQKAIQHLEAVTEKLSQQIEGFSKAVSGIDAPANEKPPHY
ncbi:MAG: SlyX family protein [Desulfobacterales bacterium]|nr:SlyX family protein [Desulfobacterales bacterium]